MKMTEKEALKQERAEAAESIRRIREKFPQFSKIALCMIRNPDYGVEASQELVAFCDDNDIALKGIKRLNRASGAPAKKPAQRKKPNRVSAYVDDRLMEKIKKNNTTTQELVEKLLREWAEAVE